MARKAAEKVIRGKVKPAKRAKPTAKPTKRARAKVTPVLRVKPKREQNPATATWTAKRRRVIRRNADIPDACPICGSERLVVQRADGAGKATAKIVASAIIPLLVVRTHPAVACRSCGWRAEPFDGGY